MRRAVLFVALMVTAGCAYYNGLYNANRLANDARRAEREGRTGEARSLWSQAAIKAESVVARFPRSKYHDDALLLQGTALFNIDACTLAVRPLGVAADSSPDEGIRRRSRLLLARCRLAMLEPDSALAALDPLVGLGDSAVRDEVFYLRGEAALALNEDSTALADLRRSGHAYAVFPRAIALTRVGRRDLAVDDLERSMGGPYHEGRWLPVLDSIGAGEPGAASQVVTAMLDRFDLSDGERARLLVGDGERWRSVGATEHAAARFTAARQAAPDSIEGRVAQAYLSVASVREAAAHERIAGLHDTLRSAADRGGTPALIAGLHITVLGRARLALGRDGSDLALFVAAEDVRDTLEARQLAASMFEYLADRYPESVIAPKALLASAVLQPALAEGLVARAMARYPASVYVLALRGEAGERYRAVEDSLRQLLTEEVRAGETEGSGRERRIRPRDDETRRGGRGSDR